MDYFGLFTGIIRAKVGKNVIFDAESKKVTRYTAL